MSTDFRYGCLEVTVELEHLEIVNIINPTCFNIGTSAISDNVKSTPIESEDWKQDAK